MNAYIHTGNNPMNLNQNLKDQHIHAYLDLHRKRNSYKYTYVPAYICI